MMSVERMIELATRLREEGAASSADELATAHEGIFSGTELFMKWRFVVAKVSKVTLSDATSREVDQVLAELNAALS